LVEIVSARPVVLADEAFAEWLVTEAVSRDEIPPEDLRVDTIRTEDGSVWRRYFIQRSTLERLRP
jgi:hypothetical protein